MIIIPRNENMSCKTVLVSSKWGLVFKSLFERLLIFYSYLADSNFKINGRVTQAFHFNQYKLVFKINYMNGELQVPDHYNNLIYFISYLSSSLNPFWPNMRTVQIFPSRSHLDSSILTYCNQAQYNKCLIWRFGLSNNQNGYQIIFNMFISQSTLISLFIPQERQLTAMSKCYT